MKPSLSYVNPRFVRTPAADLRQAPVDIAENARLRIAFFDSMNDRLPNGRPRPDFVHAVCAFRVGPYHGLARVERDQAGPVLAVEQSAYDLLRGRAETMDFSLSLLRHLYTECGRLYTLDKARRSRCGPGRN